MYTSYNEFVFQFPACTLNISTHKNNVMCVVFLASNILIYPSRMNVAVFLFEDKCIVFSPMTRAHILGSHEFYSL